MYAMVRRYHARPGAVLDVMRTIDRQVVDQAQAELGFVGYQALELADETIMTITLFPTEQALRAAGPAAERIRDRLAEFDVELIDADSGRVGVARCAPSLLEPVHPDRDDHSDNGVGTSEVRDS